MHLKAPVVLSEALFVPFLPSFETFEMGFDHWMKGGTLVEGGYVLRSSCDLSA